MSQNINAADEQGGASEEHVINRNQNDENQSVVNSPRTATGRARRGLSRANIPPTTMTLRSRSSRSYNSRQNQSTRRERRTPRSRTSVATNPISQARSVRSNSRGSENTRRARARAYPRRRSVQREPYRSRTRAPNGFPTIINPTIGRRPSSNTIMSSQLLSSLGIISTTLRGTLSTVRAIYDLIDTNFTNIREFTHTFNSSMANRTVRNNIERSENDDTSGNTNAD